jgi:hypothetical protein
MKKKTCLLLLPVIAILLVIASCNQSNLASPKGKVNVYTFNQNFIFQAYPAQTYHNIPLDSISLGYLDSSLVLVYFQDSAYEGRWYQAPGLGDRNFYLTYSVQPYPGLATRSILNLTMKSAVGGYNYTGPDININTVKLVVAPGDFFAVHKKDPVDFSDYYATMHYFGLKP